MNVASKYSVDEVANRIRLILKAVLKLSDDAEVPLQSDLVDEIGIDSIEAFELVATIHELLAVRIPETLDRKSVKTLMLLSQYITETYDENVVDAFMCSDYKQQIRDLQSVESDLLV